MSNTEGCSNVLMQSPSRPNTFLVTIREGEIVLKCASLMHTPKIQNRNERKTRVRLVFGSSCGHGCRILTCSDSMGPMHVYDPATKHRITYVKCRRFRHMPPYIVSANTQFVLSIGKLFVHSRAQQSSVYCTQYRYDVCKGQLQSYAAVCANVQQLTPVACLIIIQHIINITLMSMQRLCTNICPR